MSTTLAPALPWGNTAQDVNTEQQAPASEADAEWFPLQTVGLAIGDKLEVKWRVHVEEDGEGEQDKEMWWTATIVGPAEAPEDPQPSTSSTESLQYTIQYSALEPHFQEEQRTVAFTSLHTLWDAGDKQDMLWRKQGDMWEDEGTSGEEEEEDGAVEDDEHEGAADGEVALSMGQVEQLIRGGRSQQEEEALLNSMEPYKRIQVAAAFRDFADSFKEFLVQREAAGSSGEQRVVTEEDIHEFTAAFKKRRTG